jgi:signal transduction histidine kinase
MDSQRRADALLREAREQRAALARIVKSLDNSNQVLRRTQAELVEARKAAEAAERMKSQFVANISHELTTPLNLILGFSEVKVLTPEVYGAFEWPVSLRRDAYQVYQNSRHLLSLIDDVFDLTRFDMVGFALNREHTDMNTFFTETVEFVRDLFHGSQVQFETHIHDRLPDLDIDRTRIRQVILNLLNNARHFTESGKVQL